MCNDGLKWGWLWSAGFGPTENVGKRRRLQQAEALASKALGRTRVRPSARWFPLVWRNPCRKLRHVRANPASGDPALRKMPSQ